MNIVFKYRLIVLGTALVMHCIEQHEDVYGHVLVSPDQAKKQDLLWVSSQNSPELGSEGVYIKGSKQHPALQWAVRKFDSMEELEKYREKLVKSLTVAGQNASSLFGIPNKIVDADACRDLELDSTIYELSFTG